MPTDFDDLNNDAMQQASNPIWITTTTGMPQSPYQPGQLVPLVAVDLPKPTSLKNGEGSLIGTGTPQMYPGLQPLGPAHSHTYAATVDVNSLLAMITELQIKIKELEEHRVHVDVSKNQEERIMELEEVVAELLTEKADREMREAEAKKKDSEKSTSDHLMDALRYTGVSGSTGSNQVFGTTTTAAQAQLAMYGKKYELEKELIMKQAVLKAEEVERQKLQLDEPDYKKLLKKLGL